MLLYFLSSKDMIFLILHKKSVRSIIHAHILIHSKVKEKTDPEIAERIVAAKDDAAEIGIVAAIKRASAKVAGVFRSIQGIDPEVQPVLADGPFTRGSHMQKRRVVLNRPNRGIRRRDGHTLVRIPFC